MDRRTARRVLRNYREYLTRLLADWKDKKAARRVLRNCREYLTRQELRTLNGQIRAGYTDDAMRGLARLLAEWKDKKAEARDG